MYGFIIPFIEILKKDPREFDIYVFDVYNIFVMFLYSNINENESTTEKRTFC